MLINHPNRLTYLSIRAQIFVAKRYMHLARHFIRAPLIPRSHTVLGSTRSMAAMHGGRMKKNVMQLMTSHGTQPESDLTGTHQLVLVAECSKPGCRDQNCATETQLSTGQPQANHCGEPAQYHQQAPAAHPVISYELAGNTTSGAPANKGEATIDSQVQMNGAQKPQKVVPEKDTAQVPPGDFKQNSKATAYLQKDDRTKAIIDALPANSLLK